MPSRRTNHFPESGRGLGHVAPAIYGSTVGYPSDSLASCHNCFTDLQENFSQNRSNHSMLWKNITNFPLRNFSDTAKCTNLIGLHSLISF